MSEAYKKVQKGRPHWDKTIYIWSAVALVIFVMILVPVITMVSHQYRYHQFLQNLASSCIESRKDHAIFFVDGKKGTITDEQLNKLLMLLTDGGAGRSERKLPKDDSFRIEFPDGAMLELWKTGTKDSYTKETIPSLFVSYVGPNGKRFSYVTHIISVSYLNGILPEAANDWIARNSE